MSYRGLDFGTGLANFAQLNAQGWKDAQALRQYYESEARKAELARIENEQKTFQLESAYGPMGGVSTPYEIIPGYNHVDPAQLIKEGGEAGRSVAPRPIILHAPSAAPGAQRNPQGVPQPSLPGAPVGEPDPQATGAMLETGVGAADRLPASAATQAPGATQQDLPGPTSNIEVLVRRLGGHMGPNGEAILPNFIAKQLFENHRTEQGLEAALLRMGAGIGGRQPEIHNAPQANTGRGRGSGGRDRSVEEQIRSLEKERAPYDKIITDVKMGLINEDAVTEAKQERTRLNGEIAKLRGQLAGRAPKSSGASATAVDRDTLVKQYMKKWSVDEATASSVVDQALGAK